MSSQPALIAAASLGETFRLQDLLRKGDKADVCDKKGWSPLHAAVSGGYTDCVEVLLKEGKGNVNIKDKDGTTPLHIACTMNHLELVKLLIANGAETNSLDNKGNPIHRCCEASNGSDGVDGVSSSQSRKSINAVAVAQELLSHGAKINSKNSAGRTALHLAVQKSNVDLVRLLLAAGANKTDRDSLGMTPFDFSQDSQITQLLNNPSPMPSPQASIKATTPSPSTGTPGSFCANCGNKMANPNAKFCSNCGTKVG